jgi:hypothetical protein
MWMYAEYVARTGEILARTEGEITSEADLVTLLGLLSDRFTGLYHPSLSRNSDLGKAECMIRIGPVAGSLPSNR